MQGLFDVEFSVQTGEASPVMSTSYASVCYSPGSMGPHRWLQISTTGQCGHPQVTPLPKVSLVVADMGAFGSSAPRVYNPNDISIGSGVFAQCMDVTNRQTDKPRYFCNNRPRLVV